MQCYIVQILESFGLQKKHVHLTVGSDEKLMNPAVQCPDSRMSLVTFPSNGMPGLYASGTSSKVTVLMSQVKLVCP